MFPSLLCVKSRLPRGGISHRKSAMRRLLSIPIIVLGLAIGCGAAQAVDADKAKAMTAPRSNSSRSPRIPT